MEIKFSEKQLLKIAKSGLADMSCEQIKQLIQKESQKNYEDINTDFIDLCFDVLSLKQAGKQINSDNKKSNKIKFKKIFLIAAVFMVLIATTLTVSASVFHFNIPKEISYMINGNAEIDYNLENADTTANEYALLDTDLAKRLVDYGISPVTFPEEMIKENCKITKIEGISSDDISNIVSVDFYYNGQRGRLDIEQMSKELESTGVNNVNNIKSGQMIKVNGMDILVFEQEEGYCSIIYKDNLTTYDFLLNCDIETALKIAKSIK